MKRVSQLSFIMALMVLCALLVIQSVSARPSFSPDGKTCTPCHTDGRTGSAPAKTEPAKPAPAKVEPAASAPASSSIKIMVDEKAVEAKEASIDKGVTYVPLRLVLEAIGATVHWDGDTKTIYISTSGTAVAASKAPASSGIKIIVDGKAVDAKGASIDKGVTYVPLRLVLETIGATMEWDDATKTIDISTPGTAPVTTAAAEGYVGSETCGNCHADKHNDWIVSGHPWKIRPAEEARMRPIPLPKGVTWDDVSYMIGGYKWKARFLDKDGYVITTTGDGPGKNQYNIMTGTWGDYHPGEEKPYDCGKCHTTGYSEEGHQDGLSGIVGTWSEPGIGCEACHGPGADHVKGGGDKAQIKIDTSAALCGSCHIRGDKNEIPAKGGFIRHHEGYNELLASPHNAVDCTTCHDPHKKGEFSIKDGGDCATCHSSQATSFASTQMAKVGVDCVDCHMPKATKSAVAFSEVEADLRTHLWKINTDPTASMFTEDGSLAKGFVTLDFACLSCHKDKDVDWAAAAAPEVH